MAAKTMTNARRGKGRKSRKEAAPARPANPPTPRPAHRPTRYNQAIADDICLGIACSSKSVATLCLENINWPARTTVFRWLQENPAFRDQYARAKEFQAESLFDELIEIADTPKAGSIVTTGPSGTKTKVADMLHHRQLQIDARKFVLAKLNPKKYGDYLRVDETRKPALTELLEQFRSRAPQQPPGDGD